MRVQTEFSRYAEDYSEYNVIQKRVVSKLISDLKGEEPENILDLGCGNGALYSALTWKPKYFLGVDFAPGMLEMHPKSEGVECVYGDFNDSSLFEHLQYLTFDRVFSASALQWASDMQRIFFNIAALQTPVSLAIFTSNTFSTLYKTSGLEPLLLSRDKVESLARSFFDAKIDAVQYELAFETTREMFRYIKKSGVSAGRNVLTYKQTKELMHNYPLDYLEFEVLFIRT